MARGKYSPTVSGRRGQTSDYSFNAKGEIPPETWGDGEYNEEIHFGNYDKDGFDSYGYSAYFADGTYAGIGSGVDRNGNTESQYQCMTAEEFDYYL